MGIDKAIDVAIVLLSKHAALKVKRTALKIDEIHFAAAACHDGTFNGDLVLVGGLVCTSAVLSVHAGFSHVIGKLSRNVFFIEHFCRLATIISYQIVVLILQRLRASDIILTRMRIRDCKLGTIAHIEKRLIIIARVLYLEAIKIKGDIATTLIENNLFVAV